MTKDVSDKAYRFIPFRKHDIVNMLLQENRLTGFEEQFITVNKLLASVYHYEYHEILESLKNSYAPYDPDADTRSITNSHTPSSSEFEETISHLLEKANYERISQEDLNQALTQESMFRIRLHVDFDDYSEVLLFCRGISRRVETISSFLGLFKRSINFINYDRVVLYLRYKDDYIDQADGDSRVKSGATFLKLFQNVPQADLEMLFPNTVVRMRLIDKLLIGVPAVISGGVVITTKLGSSLVLMGSLIGFWLGLSSESVELNQTTMMVLLAGVAALGGYLWKQFNNFKNRKLRFMQALTKNLYFKNLDNNAGVFYRIANDAEEEECKEAIIAYYFLLVNECAMTKRELDGLIESWLFQGWKCQVDFEIEDALDKLTLLKLVSVDAGKYSAVSLEQAMKILDRRWDEYFSAS